MVLRRLCKGAELWHFEPLTLGGIVLKGASHEIAAPIRYNGPLGSRPCPPAREGTPSQNREKKNISSRLLLKMEKIATK